MTNLMTNKQKDKMTFIPRDSPMDSPARSESAENFSSSSSLISSDDYSRVPASQQQKVRTSDRGFRGNSVRKFVSSLEQSKTTVPTMREKTTPVRMKLRKSFEPTVTNPSDDKFSNMGRELISGSDKLTQRKVNRNAVSAYSSSSSGDDVFLESRKSVRHNMESALSIQERISQMRQDSSKWKEKQGSDSFDSSSSSPKKERAESVHDRLKKLEESSKKWEERIVESDAKQFTVKNRMSKLVGDEDLSPPVVMRNNPGASRTPQMRKSMRDSLLNCSSSPVNETRSPSMKCISRPYVKAISEDRELEVTLRKAKTLKTEISPTSTKSESKPDIPVPKIFDEEMSSFFDSQSSVASEENIEVDIDTFNDLFLDTRDVIHVQKRPCRPGRSRHSASCNPLKALSKRKNIKSSYEESLTSAEREKQMKNIEKIASRAGLLESAIRALTSTEDFSAAKTFLHGIDDESNVPISKEFLPYKSPMLLLVKGRRHCQTRLVRPSVSSINRGDCYILVTTNKVFVLLGEFSNIIEQSKVMELGQWITTKKDLGYRGNPEFLIVIDMIKKTYKEKDFQMFWNELNSENIPSLECLECGCVDDDEQYEQKINETNCVYKVLNDQLIPDENSWGKVLKYELLKDTESFVFDFGSELYYWTGKHAPLKNRKNVLELLKLLHSKGFDYSQCSINPICPFICDDGDELPWKSESRPDWVLVAKINQNMETVLFKEKFIDWPDSSRLIQCSQCESVKSSNSCTMKPIDSQVLLSQEPYLAHCVLENRSVGRGGYWKEIKDGIVRRYEVTTHSLKMWYISEFERTEAPDQCLGQFYSEDNIVVRWEYSMLAVGRKNIGNQIKEPAKYHYAYFFWQGSGSKITQQGAAALMTLDLDSERGPQIRVKENNEPPVFCHLFNGKMITFEGSRHSRSMASMLFVVRGDRPVEANLYQVPFMPSSLRSRSALVLVNFKSGRCWLWIGQLCPDTTLEAARTTVKFIKENRSPSLKMASSLTVSEAKEKTEPPQFWEDLNSKPWISPYSEKHLHPLKLWQLSGVTGTFLATEIVNVLQPDPGEEIITPLPFHQCVLYGVNQPALFLLDGGSIIYLWQGWIPEMARHDSNGHDQMHDLDSSNRTTNHTGSLHVRFDSERQAALATAKKYAKARNVERCVVVYAGLEPESFKQLFFFWKDVDEAARYNTQMGRLPNQEDPVDSLIEYLQSLVYPIDVLKQRPLPEGVDPKKIEEYLDPRDFYNLFKMTMEEFKKLSLWKQTDEKKKRGLF